MTEIETGLFDEVRIYFNPSILVYGNGNAPAPIVVRDARVNYAKGDRFLHVCGAQEEYSFQVTDVKSIYYKHYKS